MSRIQPVVELLTWSGPSPVLALLHIALSSTFQNLGRYEEMQVAAERAEEIAEAIGNELLPARAITRPVRIRPASV